MREGPHADEVSVRLSDGGCERVTAIEGSPDTVSLSSECVGQALPDLLGYCVATDADGRPAAFVGVSGGVVDPARLVDVLEGADADTTLAPDAWPLWLPKPTALDMGFAVEEGVAACLPGFWPPVMGDES